jgi:hypothetical protein
VKSHLAIVIMCVVSILVLPTVIYFSSAWNAKIAKQIESRVTDQVNKINKVSNVTVTVKPLTPEDEGVDVKKTINPTILEDVRVAREKIKADAERLEQLAIDINQEGKTQLVPGLLPKPERSVAQDLPFRIHDAYMDAHDRLLVELNAGMPQDPTLIQEKLTEYRDNYLRSQFNVNSINGLSETEYKKLMEAMTQRRLALYAQVARDYSVYADKSVFALQQWERQQAPDSVRWYEWQHTYWVNGDIVSAINKANSSSRDRRTIAGSDSSVVKRIRSISVTPIFPANMTAASLSAPDPNQPGSDPSMGGEGGMMMEGGMSMESAPMNRSKFVPDGEAPVRSPGAGNAAAAKPVDASAVADATQPFPTDFTKSISGRTPRNGLYDMRKVSLDVVVDSTRLDELFEAINSTNFMTVTGFRVQPIEPERELANGFLYGADPVIAAQIEIETLWLRDWTANLMPDPVKSFFGIATEEPQG